MAGSSSPDHPPCTSRHRTSPTAGFSSVSVPTDDVERYLDDVAIERVVDLELSPFDLQTRTDSGSAIAAAPGSESFWVASAESNDRAELSWALEAGDYEIVVMNADGSAGIITAAEIGASLPSSTGLWILVTVIGLLIMLGGARRSSSETGRARPAVTSTEPATPAAPDHRSGAALHSHGVGTAPRIALPMSDGPVRCVTPGRHPVNAASRSSQRSSTCSIPTLSRSRPGGTSSCPASFARRSMVDSTPPRLVALTTIRTAAHTASAATAPPATSNDSIAPNPSICAAARWCPGSSGSPGIAHPRHGRVRQQPPGQFARRFLRAGQPDRQGSQPAQRQVRLEGTRDRTRQLLPASHPGQQIGIGGDHQSQQQVRVAADELGRAVHHQVGAELQRPLQQGSGEGVVHDDQRAAFAAEPAQRGQVGDVHQRIGRRLQPQQVRGPRGLLRRRRVGDVDGRHLPPPDERAVGQQGAHPGVGIGRHDDVRADRDQVENCCGRTHSGTEGHRGAHPPARRPRPPGHASWRSRRPGNTR